MVRISYCASQHSSRVTGLLLQSAISTYPDTFTNETTVAVGMARDLPSGYSAFLHNGTFAGYGGLLELAIVYADPNLGLPTEGAYWNFADAFGPGKCGMDDFRGTCNGTAHSPGFRSVCTTSRIPYDISPASHNYQPFRGTILSSNVSWDASNANSFNLTVTLKDRHACIGEYLVRQCTFHAVDMSYPLQSFPCNQLTHSNPLRAHGSGEGMKCLSLNAESDHNYDEPLSDFPSVSEVGSSNSTFAGLVHYLQSVYNANLEWDWNGAEWSINATGQQALDASINSKYLSGDGNAFSTNNLSSPEYCNNTLYRMLYTSFNESFANPEETIVEYNLKERVRSLMFYSSAIQFTHDKGPIQYTDDEIIDGQVFDGTRSADVVKYKMHYRYWVASLAVTSTIIAMITPTFYGFWLLRGRPTLSPVDTATALDAPIVQTDHEVADQRLRLKEIGQRPLYAAGRDGQLDVIPGLNVRRTE
jgi:hypothetical protein